MSSLFLSFVIFLSVTNELASNLPLQMLLFFNMFYFPCWWFSAAFMLEVKVGLHLIPRLPFRFEFKSLLKGEDYGDLLGPGMITPTVTP